METKPLFPGKLVSTILASVRPLALVDHLDVTLEVSGGVEVVATGSANVVFALVDTPAKIPKKREVGVIQRDYITKFSSAT